MAAGLRMAAFVMPGLAGDDAKQSRRHAQETVEVLNEIQPTEVRVRSLAVLEGTPLFTLALSGAFSPPSEDTMIQELETLIQGLAFDCTFETLQMTNPLFSVKGRLSRARSAMLAEIERYRALSPLERARFLLARFVHDGYLDCVRSWGKLDTPLSHLIEAAAKSLDRGNRDALEKTRQALFAIKSKGVP